jgi:hypothetical protein
MIGNVRRRGAVLAIAALLALPACTDDQIGQPRALGPASASPNPSEPTLPPPATKRTAEGARAFAMYVVDVINYSQRTGDVELFSRVSGSECRTCSQHIPKIRNIYRAGSLHGGDIEIERVDRVLYGKNVRPVVAMDVRINPDQRVDHAGEALAPRTSGDSGVLSFYLDWSDGAWVVNEMVFRRSE